MLRNKGQLLLGAAMAALLIGSAPKAEATTGSIRIAVAANFNDALNDLITAWSVFEAGNGNTYTATAYAGATGTLVKQITSSSVSFYDLFFAADTTTPNALFNSSTTFISGPPFTYAQGGLVLWSGPHNSVDITASGLPYPLTTNLVIADPSSAPYGLAAATVLNDAPWSLGLPTSTSAGYPVGFVNLGGNIGSVYSTLLTTNTYAYGFVAKSQVCRAATTAPYTAAWNVYSTPPNSGTVYAYEYYPEGGGSSAPNLPSPVPTSDAHGHHTFQAILQSAIQVKGTGSSAALQSFLAYLDGDSTFPDQPATDIIKSYCYRWALGQ
ncbi:substrate-binding domain-containing protein [Methyloferula stellata]|uniref:substrate-binding domain-containing protein n=1 Tax=Methyloferula stellata TaxID=876270 RepID=UPI000363DCEC|nr:substrate-binding domain-containing protein [Methyloferula stellata]